MLMYQRVWVSAVLVITAGINAMPAPGNTGLKSDILNSNEDQVIVSQITDNDQSQVEDVIGVREKRHIVNTNETPEILINKTQSNETSFEDYEKEYLLNLTINLLEQFLHYDKYLNRLKEENSSVHGSTSKPVISPGLPTPLPHTGQQTTPDVRVDPGILQQKLLELRSMNLNDLEKVFNSLHRAAKNGVEDPGITSLCCNLG